MCSTCGCSSDANVHVHERHGSGGARATGDQSLLHIPHHHGGSHLHTHDEAHSNGDEAHDAASPEATRILRLEQDILAKNATIAARNREWFQGRRVLALNLMSSPGAGKTTLLERTIRDFKDAGPVMVIEGDQETERDAARIRQAGARAIQINTGSGCHLDSAMLSLAIRKLDPATGSLLLIENVGNLVCPALFDLGEAARVLVMSVTEGEDKPLKYPHMFRSADILILSKIDLLPHLNFKLDEFVAYALQVNPGIKILQVSAATSDGLNDWYAWLRAKMQQFNFACGRGVFSLHSDTSAARVFTDVSWNTRKDY
jgi:hydrogenase nickel incorporation protein HypB